MKLAGVLAALVVVAGLSGQAISPAAAASQSKQPAGKASKAGKASPDRKPAAQADGASAKAPAKAGASRAAKPAATRASKASSRSKPATKAAARPTRPKAGASSRAAAGAARQSSAARASEPPARFASKTPQPGHADRGAAAALASAGIGAKAVQTSLHRSIAEPAGTHSIGEAIGLHRVPDPLALRSAVALVVDPKTGEILYDKNSNAVLPIASITKVMMAMVVLDARQSLDERIAVTDDDRDTERFSASRLPIGTVLTRSELLQLALMSSENRAASALARNYPGGMEAFVAAANRKAAAIGMRDSVFMDGTGLSSSNVSTARDLAVMVAQASRYPLISRYSTAPDLHVRTAHGARVFRTTNRMVASSDWDLTLQKTGYINESGNCLVMRGNVDGRSLILVLLDSYGRYSRLGDAQRIKRWLEG
jgi:serine-type D-Ala-D-Ala endopeptidase (penicillin-binding protein 7)